MRIHKYDDARRADVSEAMSVRCLAIDILSDFDRQFEDLAIDVELDLEGGDSKVPSHLIRSAISALIENAIQAMPDGGELSLTLIESGHQCELEIADSGAGARPTAQPAENQDEESGEGRTLKLVPVLRRRNLEAARRMVAQLGGELETWDCPQGGTAHVLVFPIYRQRMAG